MKVILLQHLSGADSFEAGSEYECSDNEALRFIQRGIAKALTPKAHNDLMAKVEKLEAESAAKELQVLALQREEELKSSADALLGELVSVLDAIATLDPKIYDEYKKLIESKLKKGK